MLQALTTPVLTSVVLGGLLLGAGLGAAQVTSNHATSRRLVLHAPEKPHALYLSAWDEGDVRIDVGDKLQPMRFEIRASVSDGCRWLAIETLDPIDDRTFSYDYSEYIIECNEDATPASTTPRTGFVVVED